MNESVALELFEALLVDVGDMDVEREGERVRDGVESIVMEFVWFSVLVDDVVGLPECEVELVALCVLEVLADGVGVGLDAV